MPNITRVDCFKEYNNSSGRKSNVPDGEATVTVSTMFTFTASHSLTDHRNSNEANSYKAYNNSFNSFNICNSNEKHSHKWSVWVTIEYRKKEETITESRAREKKERREQQLEDSEKSVGSNGKSNCDIYRSDLMERDKDGIYRKGPKAGLIIDAYEVSRAISFVKDGYLEGKNLNESTGLSNPTSVELARWIFRMLFPKLPMLASVQVENTEGCTDTSIYRVG